MNLILVAIILWQTIICTKCANILGIFSIPSPSHHILGSALLKGLAKKGHQVTMLSPYSTNMSTENYTDIHLDGIMDAWERSQGNMMSFNSSFKGAIQSVFGMSKFSRAVLDSNSVRGILQSNATFDAIITVHFFTDVMLGFAHHYNAPLIILCTTGTNEIVNNIMRNPGEYAYVPNLYLHLSSEMNFLQRTVNVLTSMAIKALQSALRKFQHAQLLSEYFPDAPPLQDLHKYISLMLINSHDSIESPRPYLPNMIPIGGFHILEEELPSDLKTFLDEATSGAVYFSLGSNLKSSKLPKDKLVAILNTFSRFPNKNFLWKFEDELLEAPGNVKVKRWLPQRAILGHPNTELFISHGGLLSTTEAVYFGVPMVGIPAFGDQKANIANAVAQGYAVRLDISDLSETSFYKAIYEVLNNPKYSENIKRRSSLLRGQIVHPMDTATYWVEHVIKHKGAEHMKHAGLKLSWYQYALVDVFIFLGFIVAIILYSNYYIIRKLLKYIINKFTSKLAENKLKIS